ncbi:IPT/TIG domain-containing protein [Streptomyces sp. NPDC048717]|uniref:lipase family protein n=1 Tax=Streptomyces sp. NPDC048717 TaxID=3154928 RepID=UPI003432F169
MSAQQITPATKQVAMALAAIAATAATPRPSGESVAEQCARMILGVNQQLTVPLLATQGGWSLVWAALSEDNANMAYLARTNERFNQFAVVLRGTVAGSVTDLLEDLDVGTVVPFTALRTSSNTAPPYVSKGAMEAFCQIMAMSTQGITLVQALAGALASAPPNPTVLVTGHSLGGALATMVAPYLRTLTWPGSSAPAFGLYTFAAPTAGGPDFAKYVSTGLSWVVNERYVNNYDVVPLAWTSVDTAKSWYPDGGPAADFDAKAVISAIAGLPGPNKYAQPGPAIPLNPNYDTKNTAAMRKSVQDFMAQAAYQHSNDVYLRLLQAPALLPGPVVTGIKPNAGQAGSQVTISGSGFAGGVAIDFGPVAYTGTTIVEDDNTITVWAPPGIGVVDVRVTTRLGTSPAVPTAQFAYGGPPPVLVTGINPTHGKSGTQVTISGVNFTADATVSFGSVQAPGALVAPPDTITVNAPSGVTGPDKPSTVNVTVLSNGYSSPSGPADEYSYPDPVSDEERRPEER